MGSNRTLLAFALIGLIALGSWTGCSCGEPAPPPAPTPSPSQARPAPIPRTTPAPVKVDPPTSLREQLAEEVDLPRSYPEDAPRYPGARASTTEWRSGRLNVIFSSSDPVDQVTKWMEDFYSEHGWSDIQSTDMPQGKILLGFKMDEGRKLAVLMGAVEEEGEKATVITVTADP